MQAQFEMPRVLPRALPPAAADVPNFRAGQFHQRAVRGEILSDESGRLYEKLGRQIRPIHQLASGQFGEAIDLVPTAPATTRMIPPVAGPNAVEPSVKTKAQSGLEEDTTNECRYREIRVRTVTADADAANDDCQSSQTIR